MIKNNVMGIIFANSNDELMPELTQKRSMASIPFGGRYRFIDFPLSNLVNAGVSKVGVITKGNYNSLLDHLGSGISWDLDRKNGGLFMLPPFSTEDAGFFKGRLDALAGVMPFLKRSNEDYVVLCDSDVISNIDIDRLLTYHKSNNAGITISYKNGILPKAERNTLILDINKDETVNGVFENYESEKSYNYSLDTFVINRDLLIKIVEISVKYKTTSLTPQLLKSAGCEFKVMAYNVTEFAEIVYSKERYAEISMSLLNRDNRNRLFNTKRPIYTKTRDDMPTRYGVNSSADNCLIACGCIIEGNVAGSILFRSVEIGKNTDVSNCIIMQGTKIGKNCTLKNVIIDKAAVISDGLTIMGSPDKYVYVGKEKHI